VICKCGAKFAAREELAGKAIECTACGKSVQVPHHAPAGTGGAGKGLVISGLFVLAAAIVGCGYMIYTQQERIAVLKGSLDDLDGALSAATQRLDVLNQGLAANTEADAAMSAGRKLDQTAIAALQEDLAAETGRRQALVGDLDRLDTEALQIRSDIQRAEKDRDDAWEKISRASRDKQKEYDIQLEKLQEELTTKADDQATRDRIAAEVKRIEDAKDALAAQAKKDRAQLKSYDSKIDGLKVQLRDKTTKQNQLQFDLDQAESKLQNLTQTVNKKPLQTQLQTLQTKVDKSGAEAFQTVTFDDKQRLESMWFRLDTRSGRVTYKVGSQQSIIQGGPSFGGWGQKQEMGRYKLQLTTRETGNIHDVVLLDTEKGWVWSCRIGMSSARNLAWRWAQVVHASAFGAPTKAGKWRMSVSRDGGARRPLLVLTDPNGVVYDDDGAHRTLLFAKAY
ncbi:MAG: hypothetical protein ACYSUN_00005, partial [Planctomycetota bacterium]|jgi:hypothetical protein